MLTNADIRRMARESLRGNWVQAIVACIIFNVVLLVVNLIPNVGPFLQLIIGGPLLFGIYLYFITLIRGGKPALADVFSGFPYFVSTFLLYLVMSIFIMLWTLLLIVPGVIATLKYSQAFFIMNDNPEIGAMEAIRQSKEMMEGHKTRLFMLYLSFIGWMLLCVVTAGIALIWVGPYLYAAMAAFYHDLKHRKDMYATTDFNSIPV
ncbi:DUF975 family protein [Paenibacillus sp. NPDC056579]|uniref:DUF975 family protein n=1 Tax=unclassified Paenibacillus TaxID=185978 RepID=UPI001EF95F9E|nr:DUF975 family protein [Paenibacillus sp. H1-7]ULL13252.1 DUF975 family protein [Paenibacillus sp. H1-7]